MRRVLGITPSLLLALAAAQIATAQKPTLVFQTGHSKAVRSVAFSAEGKLVASGAADNTVRLWDAVTGIELRTLTGHTDAVTSVAFHPAGRRLASGGWDGTVKVWDLESGQELYSQRTGPDFIKAVSFSPDGKILATAVSNSILLREATTGTLVKTLTVGNSYVTCLAFSPDGALLASGSDNPSYKVGDGSDDNAVKIWDLVRGVELLTLKGHTKKITSVAFNPRGSTLLSTSDDRTIRIWNVADGKERLTLKGHSSSVDSAAFSYDGKLLASGGFDGLKVWDAERGVLLRTISGHTKAVSSVVFSPAALILASGSADKTIKLWNPNTGTEILTLKGTVDPIQSLAFSPDGKFLGSGQGAFARLWRLQDGVGSHLLTGFTDDVQSVAFSPDSKTLATGNSKLQLWDAASGIALKTFTTRTDYLQAIAFSPNGHLLAGVSLQALSVWSLSDGGKTQTVFVGQNGAANFGVLPKDSPGETSLVIAGHANSVAFSPDSAMLATGDLDGVIYLWDAATLKPIRPILGNNNEISSVAFSPDGKTIASGTWLTTSFPRVNLCDVASGKRKLDLAGHSKTVTSVAFSPDGATLASGSEDLTIKLWNVATGRELATLRGSTAAVSTLMFSPDGKLLASGGKDAQIRIWDVQTGTELASLSAIGEDWIVVTPDGLFDGSPGAWTKIIWRFNNSTFNYAPAEAFFSDFYYPGLLADIISGKRPKAPADISQKDRRQPQLKLSITSSQLVPTQIKTRSLAVKLNVSLAPAGAQDVRLFRNGSLVKVWHGDVLPGKSTSTLEATIPIVAGPNTLTAYAFNRDNIKSSDATLVVTGAESLKRQGTAYIISVGVNQYANARYNLKYAVADAQEFSAEVKRRLEEQRRYAHVEVISLSDAEATKANIMQQLTSLPNRVQPEDTVIVYFAGHGTAAQNRFYLIPHDLGYDGPRLGLNEAGLKTILAHSISDVDLNEAFEKIDAGQLLLVIDACNSGQALEAEEKRRGPMNSKGLAQLAYEKGMYVLTAAQSYQAALEAAKLGHGFLTYALVDEGLKQGSADREPHDGRIELREWLNYATDEVPHMQEANLLDAIRGRGIQLIFAGDGTASKDKDNVQRPRIFYRRELEANPLIVAILGAAAP